MITKGAKGIPEFKGHEAERQPFDFEEGGRADQAFRRSFGFTDSLFRADGKRTASNSAVQSLIFKALNDPSERKFILTRATRAQKKRGGAAGGYIPNFAMGALDQAIARESAAGLPINQIRINQDSSLRNAGNPMGLAVTNMRDEPTGAIPNAAKGFIPNYMVQPNVLAAAVGGGSRGATPPPLPAGGGRGAGDLLTKIFAVQAAFMMLTPIMGEMTNQSKAMSGAMTALNIAMSAMFVTSSFGAKNVGSFFTGQLGSGMASSGFGAFAAGGGARGLIGKGAGAQSLNLLKGLGGAVTSVLGPLAALAGATFLLSKAFNLLTGRTSRAAERSEIAQEAEDDFRKNIKSLGLTGEFEAALRKAAEKRSQIGIENVLGRGFSGPNQSAISDLIPDRIRFGGGGLSRGRARGEINLPIPEVFKSGADALQGLGKALGQLNPLAGARGGQLSGIINVLPEDDKKGREDLRKLFQNALESPFQGDANQAAQILDDFGQLIRERQVGRAGLVGTPALSTVLPLIKEGELEQVQLDLQNVIGQRTEFAVKEAQEKAIRAIPERLLEDFGKQLSFEAEARKLNITTKPLFDEDGIDGQISTIAGERKGSRVDLRGTSPDVLLGSRDKIADIFQQQGGFTADASVELANVLGEQLDLQALQLKNTRLANQEFKSQVKLATQLAKIQRGRLSVQEDVLKGLKSREALRKGLIFEQEKDVANERLKLDINNETLSTVDKIVNLGTDLTVNEKERTSLLAKIRGLNISNIDSEKTRKDLLEEASKMTTNQGKELEQAIKNEFRALDASRAKLNADKERSDELREQNRLLDLQRTLSEQLNIQAENKAFEDRSRLNLIDRGRIEAENLFQGRLSANPALNVSDQRVDQMQVLQSRLRQLEANTSLQRRALDESAGSRAINFLSSDPVLREQVASMLSAEPSEEFADKNLKDTLSGLGRLKNAAEAMRVMGDTMMFGETDDTHINKFIAQIETLTLQLKDDQGNFELSSSAAKQLAEAQIELAKKLRLPSLDDLLINQADSIFTGQIEQDFRGKTGTSAFGNARILQNSRRQQEFFNRNFSIDAQGIITKTTDTDQALSDLRRLNETNQLSDSLISASESFAQNIGSAMVDAIARGGDLGDALMSAASNFANMLSTALMQSAVNDIVGGTGVGGIMGGFADFLNRNSGGMVRGGSGTRDDIPTLLTGGEFVMRKSAVQRYGPEFMAALNSGRVGGMQTGGMFTPGTFGQGAITGKSDLLSFSTQSFTGGSNDILGGSGGLGFASLEPQSGRLTMFGRRNSPMFQREQESKRAAFGLYARQVQLEEQEKERAKQQRKGLLGSIIGAVASVALKGVTNKVFGGGKAPIPNRVANIENALQEVGIPIRSGGSSVLSTTPPLPVFDSRFSPANSNRGLVAGEEFFMNTRLATGGYVSPRAGIDNVPTMLSGGEFVMNAAATQRIGAGNLAAANAGGGGGEGKEAVVARLDELIAVTQNSGETVINITVNSDGSQTEEGSGGEEEQNLARRIRDVVKQTIDDEQRLGGSLRRV